MRTYDEKQIKAIFKQQGYKYASLRDSDGKVKVTYNTETTKGGASSKVDEAFKRLDSMPDGVYTFCFLNSKGRNVQPDEFGFVKGNIATDESGKGVPYHIINQMPTVSNAHDKVLSYPEVLKLQMELTRTTFERDEYKKELDKANATISELESELKTLEDTQPLADGGASSPMAFMETLATQFMPVIDRFMTNKEKALELKERQLNQRPKPRTQATAQPKKFVLPVIGSAEFEQWLDNLEKASDEDYNRTLQVVQQQSPSHYQAIIEAFTEQEDEPTNEDLNEEN